MTSHFSSPRVGISHLNPDPGLYSVLFCKPVLYLTFVSKDMFVPLQLPLYPNFRPTTQAKLGQGLPRCSPKTHLPLLDDLQSCDMVLERMFKHRPICSCGTKRRTSCD